jgi:hypothetical protein
MAPRRKKPCPPLGGYQFKGYGEYEQHANRIRKESDLGRPLDGPALDYALAWLRWHEDWEEHLAEHGQPEAVTVEWNTDVPSSDKRQFWVHYEDGFSINLSYKKDRNLFGYEESDDLSRKRKLRDIKLAARQIIRPLHEELKHRSGLSGELDVHHDKESFQSLLFRFFWDELGLRFLSDIQVAHLDNIGTKRFTPEEVARRWYEFHEREATLVVMTKADHQAWHSLHGKDAEPAWEKLL